MAPAADPADTKVIAKVRFFLKYSENTATLGTYIMPPTDPCVREICKRGKTQTSSEVRQDQKGVT